jgi:hypothetical protein
MIKQNEVMSNSKTLYLWVDQEGSPGCDDTESTGKVVYEDVPGPTPGQLENKPCSGPGPGRGRIAIKLSPGIHLNLEYIL